LAIVVLVVAQTLAELLASVLVLLKVPMGICNIVAGILYLAFAYIILKLVYEKFLHEKLSDFGITKFKFDPKWLVIGLLLPICVIGFYLLAFKGEYVSGGLTSDAIFARIASGIFFGGMAGGFVEEMVFRGIIFRSVEKAWNTKIAAIFPSVLFGAVHILGLSFTPLSCILVILAGTAVGIMFTMITIESGSIWSDGIVHMLWNSIVIGGIITIGTAVDDNAIMSYIPEIKTFPITGGEFGIESSVISLVAYVIVAVIAYIFIRNRRQAQ
ncbi:MAG: CPBP family intramembrane metalloprotease, partial [Lachnospiraceae bacterium]|nr:CPBP family intramembrane metalloprotease [Lachnospiraceae bacterium]